MTATALHTGYVTYLVVSALAAAGVAYWFGTRVYDGDDDQRAFLALLGLTALWAGLPAVSLLLPRPAVVTVVEHLRAVVGLTGVLAFGAFAFEYTGHSTAPRRPAVAAFLGGYVVLVAAVVTNPVTGLYWESLTVAARPFPHPAFELGPGAVARNLWAYLLILTGLAFLFERFLKSRHRSSTAVFVLGVGAVVASIPNLTTFVAVGPLPRYDHTAFGIAPFTLAAAYGVYGLGAFDLAPVARDELLGTVEEALVVLDADRRVVDYNPAADALSPAFRDGDPIGEAFGTVLPSLAADLELPAAGDDDVTTRFSVERDGAVAHYSVLATPIADDGDLAGYALMLRDITEIERYRRELERQNEQLKEFADTLTHDLRNPLQAATAYSTLVRSELEASDAVDVEDGEVEELLRELDYSLDRIKQIIADLREMARKGRTVEETEPVAFERAVEDALRGMDDAPETRVERGGTVQADPGRLLNILENLLSNSVDHSEGEVTVVAGVTADGFYLQDDGPGIPEDEREVVFEYGHTTRQTGSGMGLSIVRTMAETHDWSVEIDPEYDGGTRFVFTGAVTSPSPTGGSSTGATASPSG